MKRLLLIITLVFAYQPSFACMVEKDWAEKTTAKVDTNRDGKISYDEYKTSHNWTADEENIALNNWKSAIYQQKFVARVNLAAAKDKNGIITPEEFNKTFMAEFSKCQKEKCEENLKAEDTVKEFLTIENYLGGVRPKCAGI